MLFQLTLWYSHMFGRRSHAGITQKLRPKCGNAGKVGIDDIPCSFPLNWKETMLVKSYIPSGTLPIAAVKRCCLMYTHAPSAPASIIPLPEPPSRALLPLTAPCCLLSIYWIHLLPCYIFPPELAVTSFIGAGDGDGRRRRGEGTLVFSSHASCSSERRPSRAKWTNREDDLDLFCCSLVYII